MPTSLLLLPDELLVLVVDQAMGEYAPRLYKQRQETACALALVNKRVGRIAGDKLLEAVHISFGDEHGLRGTQLNKMSTPARARALHVGGLPRQVRPLIDFAPFAAVRDLRLSNMTRVPLDDISQLRDLHTLILWHGSFVASRPFAALKLERLQLYFCDAAESQLAFVPFAAAGLPSLQHVYLGLSVAASRHSWAQELVERTVALGVELLDLVTAMPTWSGVPASEAVLDKTLFDLLSIEVEYVTEPIANIRHLRLHMSGDPAIREAAVQPPRFADLPGDLSTLFPSLETLYLPLALDTSRVMLSRPMVGAVDELVKACRRMRAVVVFEHDLGGAETCEDRASPHFEARCRRIKAERAAAASATTSGARAGAEGGSGGRDEARRGVVVRERVERRSRGALRRSCA